MEAISGRKEEEKRSDLFTYNEKIIFLFLIGGTVICVCPAKPL